MEARSAGGQPVRLGAAKHRVLLSILLLQANQSVHTERLEAALWPGKPPRSAPAVLRTYVSALRHSLGLTKTELASVPNGYRLTLRPEDLDLTVFTDLHRQGQQALVDGDPARAAELLRSALNLWRGRPLEDVPLDGGWTIILDEIEELRFTTVEAWAQAGLDTGRHHDVVTELRAVVTEQPLRERLCELWMTALYRSGRRADALAAYQRLRGEMVSELGVEPGPALAGLHQRMVNADPGLSTPAGRAMPVVPRQLPPDITEFTGRTNEIKRLDALLSDDGGSVRIAAVDGPDGIGKSALAVHAGHRVADRFPDGQLYVDLQGAEAGPAPLEPMVVLGRLLRALGVPGDEIPESPAEASGVWRAMTADAKLLIVLDNAHDAAQVRPLLPAGAGCAVLVTSRQVLATLDGSTHHLHLEVLSPAESVSLLETLVGAERITADRAGAERIARLCGHLPLALRIAGARLAARPTWSSSALAARLDDATRRLDELQIADLGVRASFQVSYQYLVTGSGPVDQAAATAFPLLSLLDGPDLSLPVAARLLDRAEPETEALLERLVDAQLLETPAPHRYRLHDLLRLFAREHAAQRYAVQERTAVVIRAVEWYIATTWRTFRLLRPGDTRTRMCADGGAEFNDVKEALAWLETERANLVAAVLQTAELPGASADLAITLAQALFGYFQVHNQWHDWIRINQTALAVARRTGDLAAQAQACCDLNVAYDFRGKYEEAIDCLTEGLTIFQLLGDHHGQSACLNGLGVVYDSQERYAEAQECLEQSLSIQRDVHDRRGQALSLNNLGVVHKRLNQDERALMCYQEALDISEQIGDDRMRAGVLTNFGEIHERQGNYTEALSCHERSLRMFRRLGDRQGQALNLGNQGRLHEHRGNYPEALTCLEECLVIQQELGDRRGQAESLQQLGSILYLLGHTDQARARWRDSLAIFTDLRLPTAHQLRMLLATS
ncbi:tetratricopeptide repeat protein [Actinocrispum sp. NPDC049592]|uniref:AfsR/SARP family transcriptional regulator n=1 Tax=Actinocrispum sp. NPDC049592 TaxID=3154835 RepID=UPI003443803E